MIDTNSIRNKVLELATSGKFTNYSPMDGCIDDLYARIVSEKEKIIESGVLKGRKNKGVKEVIDDEMLELPQNWMWIRLGEIVEVFGRIGFRGYTKADIVDANEGAITISPSNIDENGNMSFDNCTYISWEKYEESPEIQISNDDIIIVKTGSSYGKAGIVKDLPEKATINPQLAVLKYILCNKEYLNIVLNSPMARKQYEQFVIGAAIPTFSQEKLSNLLMPLPSMEEQRRIVERVTKVYEILDKIDELQKSYLVDSEILKSKLIDAAIQGKLTEQLPEDGTAEELHVAMQEEKNKLIQEGKIKKTKLPLAVAEDEIPFEIPSNWKWVRLEELAANINIPMADGPFGSNLKKEHYTENREVRIIQLSNIGDTGWRNENVKYTTFEHLKTIKRSAVNAGDIVIAKMMPAGRAIIVPDIEKQYVLSSDCVKFVPHQQLSTKYINYAINSEIFRKQVLGTVTGVGRERTSLSKLKNFLIPIPPYAEQVRIVQKLDTLLGMI